MRKYGMQYREEAGGDGENGGGGQASWRDGLSDEFKGADSLKDYTDINGLAKSHINLQQMIGNSIRIPSEDASPEARKEFYDKIVTKVEGLTVMPNEDDADATAAFWAKAGVPQDASEYALPEGVDAATFAGLNAIAKEAGLTKAQFSKLAAGLSGEGIAASTAAQEALEASHNELFKQWGSAKDDKLTAINNMLKNSNAPDTLKEAVASGNVGADFLTWADGMIQSLGNEGKVLTGQPNLGSDALTPQEAELKIEEIMSNKEHPYWNNSSSSHSAAVQKIINLQRMVNGEKIAS